MEYIEKYGRDYLEELGRKFKLFKMYKQSPSKASDKITQLKLDVVLELTKKNTSDEKINKILEKISKTQQKIEKIKAEALGAYLAKDVRAVQKRIEKAIFKLKNDLKKLNDASK